MHSVLAVLATVGVAASSVNAYVTGINPAKPPHKSEKGQSGFNDCSSKTSTASSQCQNVYLNSASDFCLFSAPYTAEVGEIERVAVSYCTENTHGTRLIPKGTLKSVHYVQTPHYIQITGTGDFTKIKIKKGDEGGELDPHGYDGLGNPIGGLVFSNARGKLEQLPNWTSFMSDTEYCFRACFGTTTDSRRYCEHIYDTMGCQWNIPGNYKSGFEGCKGDDVKMPMGEYKLKNGKTSTWHQGVSPTPAGGPAAKSSQCKKVASPTAAKYRGSSKKRDLGSDDVEEEVVEKRAVPTAHAKRSQRQVSHV